MRGAEQLLRGSSQLVEVPKRAERTTEVGTLVVVLGFEI